MESYVGEKLCFQLGQQLGIERVSTEEFFAWLPQVGIGFDPRYPAARSLALLPPRDHSRFWLLPGDPGTWPCFLLEILANLDEWTLGYLWPRCGSWPTDAELEERRHNWSRPSLCAWRLPHPPRTTCSLSRTMGANWLRPTTMAPFTFIA